jgi:hypothetical protein
LLAQPGDGRIRVPAATGSGGQQRHGRKRYDLPLSAPQVARADLAYHDINQDHGLYYQLQRDGAVERTTRDTDILQAKTRPPHDSHRQPG